MADRRPRAALLVVPPLPGERRKSSSLIVATRPWRSKWWRVACMGAARKCKAGECIHVEHVCHGHRYARPVAREDRDR